MTDLYLIAHRVRSEPAFDIAEKSRCLFCHRYDEDGKVRKDIPDNLDIPDENCVMCDGDGYQWRIKLNGHKAYPYWSEPILGDFQSLGFRGNWVALPNMPSTIKDYEEYFDTANIIANSSSPTRQSLASILAIPRPQLKVDRRF